MHYRVNFISLYENYVFFKRRTVKNEPTKFTLCRFIGN